MKKLFILCVCLLCYFGMAQARWHRHKFDGSPQTEEELMNKVLDCLRSKDTVSYYYLFPPFDTLWKMVLHNPDTSREARSELYKLREHPTVLIDLDPYYNHGIIGNFVRTLKKGEDSGVQWPGVVMQRFELQKQGIGRGMEGLELVAPERFKGYLFVRDMLSSTTFCITLTEIQKVNGRFVGGQVLNVLEASDIDQYLAKENAERKYLAHLQMLAERGASDSALAAETKKDTTKVDSTLMADVSQPTLPTFDSIKKKRALLLSVSPGGDDDSIRLRREVVDRKYYKGKFDEDIPVELYVRYMRDLKDKVTKYWDALYKFGDMSEYVKLDVSKTQDDKWLFEEPVASMELELNNRVYTGSWTNGTSQTGYDAELSQKEISQKKIEELDRILENGAWGKTDQQKILEKKDTVEKAEGDKTAKKDEKDVPKLSRKERKQKAEEEKLAAEKKAEEERKRRIEEQKKEDGDDDKGDDKDGDDK